MARLIGRARNICAAVTTESELIEFIAPSPHPNIIASISGKTAIGRPEPANAAIITVPVIIG